MTLRRVDDPTNQFGHVEENVYALGALLLQSSRLGQRPTSYPSLKLPRETSPVLYRPSGFADRLCRI